MVFRATDAATLTSNTITSVNATDVQLEITLSENKIRLAAANELYSITYDATIIGNPAGNPQIATNLSPNQQSFYSLLIGAAYKVSIDLLTGRWLISWSPQGPETEVQVYSFRTIVAPGAIFTNTKNAMIAYFASLSPIAHCIAVVNGDISETAFGGVNSVFYEYTATVDQGVDQTDHSAGLTAYVIAQGLGYNSGNCASFKLI